MDPAVWERFTEAEDFAAAEAVLDGIDPTACEPHELAARYDALASEAADDEDLAAAVRLQRKAIAAGARDEVVARETLGWYLLAAGETAAGETLFAELIAEDPADAQVLVSLGKARMAAGDEDGGLRALDDALAVAKASGFADHVDDVRLERSLERADIGIEPDEDDEQAAAGELGHDTPGLDAVGWFPEHERPAAAERWPPLAETFADDYLAELERELHTVARITGRHPTLVAIDAEGFATWVAGESLDPTSYTSRSRYAAALAAGGAGTVWPPGRNDRCWCGSGRKYKRCCGG